MAIKRKGKLYKECRGKLSRRLRIRDVIAPAAMSLGMLFAPWTLGTALAENPGGIVTKIDRQDNGLTEKLGDNFYKVYAGQVVAGKDVAINRFKTFDIDNQTVANMMFNVKGGTSDPNNLLNFVNDRIQVQGTVNAIRNGQIGGNMYFLSPNDMVVGAGGVIN